MPKIDQGDEGVEHRWVNVAGGPRVHVAEAGEGPPLLLLHGWPQHWWMWREVIPALARSHRVICADLRGHGWTDAPRSGLVAKALERDLVPRVWSEEAARIYLDQFLEPARARAASQPYRSFLVEDTPSILGGPTGGSACVSRSSCSTEPTTLSSR